MAETKLMDRRKFLAGIGLLTAGGAAGAAAGSSTAAPALVTESPTARTASPPGSQAYQATVTFRTAPAERLVALTIDDGPTRSGRRRFTACCSGAARRQLSSWLASGRRPIPARPSRPWARATN